MNLRLKDDISRYNLINHLYNLLPGEILINLKDIIGIDTVISISPGGKEINDLIEPDCIRYGLYLMPDNNLISLHLPEYFLSEFLNKISKGIKNIALTPAGLALIEYIFLKIISKEMKPEIMSRLRWSGIIESETEDKELVLIFKINFMGGVYFFSISFNERVANELIKIMGKKERTERFSDIVINITPVLAEGEIPAGEIRGIQPGDVIAFREPYIKLKSDGKKGGVIMLKTGENELIGGYNLDKNEFFYNREEKKREPEKGAKELIQNIPVTLSVELTRIRVTLKELERVVPGQLLDIQKKDLDDVLISANGKIIATGRLIDIDGTLCVEVLTLSD